MVNRLLAALALCSFIVACSPKQQRKSVHSLPHETKLALLHHPKYRPYEGGGYKVLFKGRAADSELLTSMPEGKVTSRILGNLKGRSIVIVEVTVKDYDPESILGGKAWFFFEEGTSIYLDIYYML